MYNKIVNCLKDFIQFLSECLVNHLTGEVRNLRKEDVVKYRKEIPVMYNNLCYLCFLSCNLFIYPQNHFSFSIRVEQYELEN